MTDDLRPSVVRVTDASGRLVALIDPVTRRRTNVNGDAPTTLSAQGWSLNMQRYISLPKSAPVAVLERTRHGKIVDRDGRGRRKR